MARGRAHRLDAGGVMTGVALCLLLGLALGVASSVVPGPCGLSIIDGVVRGEPMRRAVATACGGALGDIVYASIGVGGVGPLLARDPVLPHVLQAISGAVLVAYGITKLVVPPPPRATVVRARGNARRGVALGFSLVAGNPAALVTWVIVVGSLLATATTAERWATVAGIGIGTAAWFTGLAYAARRGATTRAGLLVLLTKAVSIVLVGYGVVILSESVRRVTTG